MSQTKQCPHCLSFESSFAVFCSQCRVRLGFPDMSYKVLVDDTEESARDFLPLMIISVPLIILVVIVSIFLTGCENSLPPKTLVCFGKCPLKTSTKQVCNYADALFDANRIAGERLEV